MSKKSLTVKQLNALRQRQTSDLPPPAKRIPLTRWARGFSLQRHAFFEALEAIPKHNLLPSLAHALRLYQRHRSEAELSIQKKSHNN